jgi:hypothetical protein
MNSEIIEKDLKASTKHKIFRMKETVCFLMPVMHLNLSNNGKNEWTINGWMDGWMDDDDDDDDDADCGGMWNNS